MSAYFRLYNKGQKSELKSVLDRCTFQYYGTRNRCSVFTKIRGSKSKTGRLFNPVSKSNDREPKSLEMHQFSYAARHGRLPFKSSKLGLSHTCGRHRCLNPKHIAPETTKVNNSRKICHRIIKKIKGKKKRVKYSGCKHKPKCFMNRYRQYK